MKVLFADHSQPVITSAREYNPTFDIQLGNPLAFDIDAVVSPANTRGIMNGGFDAVLRSFFGTIIEYRVRARLRENPLDVGRACAVPTSHPKINKVIVTPTVSISGSGLSGHASVSYACGYNATMCAHNAGVKVLGLTGFGTGAGGLSVRDAIYQQFDGIEDALFDIKNR